MLRTIVQLEIHLQHITANLQVAPHGPPYKGQDAGSRHDISPIP